MFDLKNVHLQPTERKLLWFLCKLMTHGPQQEGKLCSQPLTVFFYHSLCTCEILSRQLTRMLPVHVVFGLDGSPNSSIFFSFTCSDLVIILSDFLYCSILTPCTNRKNLNQKYRDSSNYYNCYFFTVCLFYDWYRRCGVVNHVQAGGQTTKCLESFRAPVFKIPRSWWSRTPAMPRILVASQLAEFTCPSLDPQWGRFTEPSEIQADLTTFDLWLTHMGCLNRVTKCEPHQQKSPWE